MPSDAFQILQIQIENENEGALKPIAHADLKIGQDIELLHVPVFRNRYGLFIADRRLRFCHSEPKRKIEAQLKKHFTAFQKTGV